MSQKHPICSVLKGFEHECVAIFTLGTILYVHWHIHKSFTTTQVLIYNNVSYIERVIHVK